MANEELPDGWHWLNCSNVAMSVGHHLLVPTPHVAYEPVGGPLESRLSDGRIWPVPAQVAQAVLSRMTWAERRSSLPDGWAWAGGHAICPFGRSGSGSGADVSSAVFVGKGNELVAVAGEEYVSPDADTAALVLARWAAGWKGGAA